MVGFFFFFLTLSDFYMVSPMQIGLLKINVLSLNFFLWGRVFSRPFAHMSHSWFVPACQHLVSHVSLPHVFTLHSSSVIELCSYWLGGSWAGMLHSWNWQSFLMWVKGNLNETSLNMKAFGFKMEELSGTVSVWAFAAVCLIDKRELICLVSPVLFIFL